MANFEALKPLMKHFTKIGPAGCSLSVSLEGKTVFTHYEGLSDIETGNPIDEFSIFRIFSNSKPITIVGLLKLYEKGKFLLNDPLEWYLPEFANPKVCYYTGNNMQHIRPAKSSITIEDLMTMSSGLTYGDNITQTHRSAAKVMDELEAQGSYTVREFAREISQIPLNFDPGTSWNYGLSHDVIGALIEVLSGKSFGEYLKNEVFDPLRMEDTYFFIPEDKKDRLVSQYYRNENNKFVLNKDRDYSYNASHKFESGGGGLLATLDDLSKFAQMLSMGGTLDGVRILGRKTIDLMTINHLGPQQLEAFQMTHTLQNKWPFLAGYGYGLGVRVMMDCAKGGSNGSVGEFGWAGIAGTWMLVDREEQLAVAYMQQLNPNNREEYCHPRLRAAIYAALD